MENKNLSGFTKDKFLGVTLHGNQPPTNKRYLSINSFKSKFLEDKNYAKSIDDFLEKKKNEIPLFDQHTGEPNMEYEKLTGKKNPLTDRISLLNKLPIVFEPKLTNRFLVNLPEELTIPAYSISSIEKPIIYIEEKYSDIKLNIRDLPGNFINKLITYLETNKKFSLEIEIIDPTGALVDRYVLGDCVIKFIDFGKSDYALNNINIISLIINYKKLTITS
jgi:hypothetical protein